MWRKGAGASWGREDSILPTEGLKNGSRHVTLRELVQEFG